MNRKLFSSRLLNRSFNASLKLNFILSFINFVVLPATFRVIFKIKKVKNHLLRFLNDQVRSPASSGTICGILYAHLKSFNVLRYPLPWQVKDRAWESSWDPARITGESAGWTFLKHDCKVYDPVWLTMVSEWTKFGIYRSVEKSDS